MRLYDIIPLVYSTTGTRIIYDRSTLLLLADSPLSRTPPTSLTHIPGVTKNDMPATLSVAARQRNHLGQMVDEVDQVSDDSDEE